VRLRLSYVRWRTITGRMRARPARTQRLAVSGLAPTSAALKPALKPVMDAFMQAGNPSPAKKRHLSLLLALAGPLLAVLSPAPSAPLVIGGAGGRARAAAHCVAARGANNMPMGNSRLGTPSLALPLCSAHRRCSASLPSAHSWAGGLLHTARPRVISSGVVWPSTAACWAPKGPPPAPCPAY
jgi:hypothetical protein